MKKLKTFENFNRTVSIEELKNTIEINFKRKSNKLLVIDNDPSNDSVIQAAKELGYVVVEFLLNQTDINDLYIKRHNGEIVVGEKLPHPSDYNTILYFDITDAPKEHLSFVYNLIFEGGFGNYQLPDNCIVICKSFGEPEIETAILNKMSIVEVE